MAITLNGMPCLDRPAEEENVYRHGIPVPRELSQANSFSSPLGPSPGRGWLLLLRSDVDRLNKNGLHTLVFDDEVGGRVSLQQLVFIKATAITPGEAGDPSASYLVELADKRWFVHNPFYQCFINAQFNVPAPNSGLEYYRFSVLNPSGGPQDYSWQTMCFQIWTQFLRSPIGQDFPGLPVTPQGKPTGFQFVGVSAWQAFCQVIDRINCAVGVTQGGFNIVHLGDPSGFDGTQAAAKSSLIYDGQVVEGDWAKIPRNVVVFFNRFSYHYGGENTTGLGGANWLGVPAYSVVVQTNGAAGLRTGTTHYLWDDLLAVFSIDGNDSPGQITTSSAAACQARAVDRASEYVSTLKRMTRLHQVYSKIWAFQPDAMCRAVCWRQAADGGLVTEVVRHPLNFFRVGESGLDECDCTGASVSMRPPDFNPTFPLYPQVVQPITITSGPTNGYYGGNVSVIDPTTRQIGSKEGVLVIDPNSA